MGGRTLGVILFALPLTMRAAENDIFPALTTATAADLVRASSVCPELSFEVSSIRRLSPRRRAALVKIEPPWGTTWAFFRWDPGSTPGAWDRWDGVGAPPGGWRLESYANVGEARESDRFDLPPSVKVAMDDIRKLASAASSWQIDQNEYPSGGTDEVVRLLVPVYARRLHLIDPWGEPYLYLVEPVRKQSYLIASSGSDRHFEYSPTELRAMVDDPEPWFKQHGRHRSRASDTDIVMVNGAFLSLVEPYSEYPWQQLTCAPRKPPG